MNAIHLSTEWERRSWQVNYTPEVHEGVREELKRERRKNTTVICEVRLPFMKGVTDSMSEGLDCV